MYSRWSSHRQDDASSLWHSRIFHSMGERRRSNLGHPMISEKKHLLLMLRVIPLMLRWCCRRSNLGLLMLRCISVMLRFIRRSLMPQVKPWAINVTFHFVNVTLLLPRVKPWAMNVTFHFPNVTLLLPQVKPWAMNVTFHFVNVTLLLPQVKPWAINVTLHFVNVAFYFVMEYCWRWAVDGAWLMQCEVCLCVHVCLVCLLESESVRERERERRGEGRSDPESKF